jgi:transcriptional regulator with XRE-family HTH domain
VLSGGMEDFFLLRGVTALLRSIFGRGMLRKTKIGDNPAVVEDSCVVSGRGGKTVAVEQDGEDPTDPSASALVHFGVEVQLERDRQGVSQSRLAAAVPCDKSLVQKIEKAKRIPSLAFAEACDKTLNGHGRFVRQWKWAIKYAFPYWLRKYIELEEQAAVIRIFHPQLIPGLLQTEGYARAVLRTGRRADLEDLVTVRMGRQHILARDNPPRLWVVLDAGVLTRSVGGREVMRGQLARLLELAANPPHVVQVLPFTDDYHGWSSSFSLLSFDEGADVVHTDAFPRGYLLAEPDDVAAVAHAYDLIRASALPPDDSAEMIASVLKDRYP